VEKIISTKPKLAGWGNGKQGTIVIRICLC